MTLPDASKQVGCVIVLNTGANGVTGCELITIFVEGKEIHPEPFVTV